MATSKFFVPAGAFTPNATNPCQPLAQAADADRNYTYLEFDATVADANDDQATATWVLPADFANDTVTAYIHWVASYAEAGNVDCVWSVAMLALADGDLTTTAMGTLQTTTDTATFADATHYITPATAAITIGNGPAALETLLVEVSLDGSATSLNGNPRFLGLWIEYTTT